MWVLQAYGNNLNKIHYLMINRYLEIIKNSDIKERARWINFCESALTIKNSDKLSRWVGFIQGVLYSENLIDIEEERNFSRPYYKEMYENWHMDSTTVDVK